MKKNYVIIKIGIENVFLLSYFSVRLFFMYILIVFIKLIFSSTFYFYQLIKLKKTIKPITKNMENSVYLTLQQNTTQPHSNLTTFSHQPITHDSQTEKEMAMFKKFVRNVEVQQRKKTIQKSQLLKKQLLEAQIAAKNFRSQLLRPATHAQVNRDVRESHKKILKKQNTGLQKNQNTGSQKKILLQRSQKCLSTDMLKARPQQILKLQLGALKGEPYVNKEKLMKKPAFGNGAEKQKENRVNQAPRQFSGIRLRKLKLPELMVQQAHTKKSTTQKLTQNKEQNQEKNRKQLAINKQRQQKRQYKAKAKQANTTLVNPVIKIYDSRYFGIQKEKGYFFRMGKGLLESVKEKYWHYESVQNQEVYEDFEDFLAGLVVGHEDAQKL